MVQRLDNMHIITDKVIYFSLKMHVKHFSYINKNCTQNLKITTRLIFQF